MEELKKTLLEELIESLEEKGVDCSILEGNYTELKTLLDLRSSVSKVSSRLSSLEEKIDSKFYMLTGFLCCLRSVGCITFEVRDECLDELLNLLRKRGE